MTPTVGRVVLVVGDAAKSNGTSTVAPGIITRVWNEHPDGGWVVNLTMFPDADVPRYSTSVRLVDTEDEALALAPSTAAYWPPRV